MRCGRGWNHSERAECCDAHVSRPHRCRGLGGGARQTEKGKDGRMDGWGGRDRGTDARGGGGREREKEKQSDAVPSTSQDEEAGGARTDGRTTKTWRAHTRSTVQPYEGRKATCASSGGPAGRGAEYIAYRGPQQASPDAGAASGPRDREGWVRAQAPRSQSWLMRGDRDGRDSAGRQDAAESACILSVLATDMEERKLGHPAGGRMRPSAPSTHMPNRHVVHLEHTKFVFVG